MKLTPMLVSPCSTSLRTAAGAPSVFGRAGAGTEWSGPPWETAGGVASVAGVAGEAGDAGDVGDAGNAVAAASAASGKARAWPDAPWLISTAALSAPLIRRSVTVSAGEGAAALSPATVGKSVAMGSGTGSATAACWVSASPAGPPLASPTLPVGTPSGARRVAAFRARATRAASLALVGGTATSLVAWSLGSAMLTVGGVCAGKRAGGAAGGGFVVARPVAATGLSADAASANPVSRALRLGPEFWPAGPRSTANALVNVGAAGGLSFGVRWSGSALIVASIAAEGSAALATATGGAAAKLLVADARRCGGKAVTGGTGAASSASVAANRAAALVPAIGMGMTPPP